MADEIYEGGYKYDMDVHKQEQKLWSSAEQPHMLCHALDLT